ncbi:MAG: hypothetical protein WAV31_01460 [Candidatus Moraniibacteriota bacterium]
MVDDKNVLNQVQGLADCLSIKERKDFNKSNLSLQEWAEKSFPKGMGELVGRMNVRNFMSNLYTGSCTQGTIKESDDSSPSPVVVKEAMEHQAGNNVIEKVNSQGATTPPMEIKKPMTNRPRGVKVRKRKVDESKNLHFSPIGYPEIIITIIPMRRSLQENEAEKHRNFFCQFIKECIDYSEDHGVCYFSCSECSQMKNSNSE